MLLENVTREKWQKMHFNVHIFTYDSIIYMTYGEINPQRTEKIAKNTLRFTNFYRGDAYKSIVRELTEIGSTIVVILPCLRP